MRDKYDLESLITKFIEHADEFDKRFDSCDPDQFNLSRALLNICQEIRNLKEKDFP